MLPGSVESTVIPALESCFGKEGGARFQSRNQPRVLARRQLDIRFCEPAFHSHRRRRRRYGRLSSARLYSHIDAPVITLAIKEAEMVKYACNCFHALKITFANEIGSICKAMGIDSHKVMDAFCKDTKLNLSAYYLKPGFAFGGSCLPKDLRAITYKAKQLDVEAAMLNSILVSNRLQVERAVDMVLSTGRKRVGVLGLSFKSGTDDLRESPMVSLIETLIGKGLKLSIYDRDVELARLFGANKSYIEHEIPHISQLMRPDLNDVVESSEVLVIGKKDDDFRMLGDKLNNGRIVIDLVRMLEARQGMKSYQGMCW